ncbi:uncharacterized protein MKZ38_009069 [Zalerion maritima]|uniref:DNA/RNA-binding domain-containing protein n=1 Tax=Zalerion maritima TaxID=339359 RepID=A0AAD5RG69_9PEZI|nr:uncharacterized protein MKZ38_009069 [Zalerion maritima]
MSQRPSRVLGAEQWQALIALHRTLLHEHHDFFLASQHPSATPALRRLATKYAMPARMWRHGIHSFLELVRHRLPASLEHMLTFLYLSYSIMALLCDTIPAFADTWIRGLGDLSRYRIAIEDDDDLEREVWAERSRYWYGSGTSEQGTARNRLHRLFAILARTHSLASLTNPTRTSAGTWLHMRPDPLLTSNSQPRSPRGLRTRWRQQQVVLGSWRRLGVLLGISGQITPTSAAGIPYGNSNSPSPAPHEQDGRSNMLPLALPYLISTANLAIPLLILVITELCGKCWATAYPDSFRSVSTAMWVVGFGVAAAQETSLSTLLG